MPVGTWTIIWASTQPVVKIILLCGVGVICARKGILDYHGRKVVSSLAFLVFIPALNFTSLGSIITPSRLLNWWPLVINVLLAHILGALLGYTIVKLVNHEHWFRRHVLAAVMFGNTGNLPLVIVSTLAQTSAEILGGIDPAQAQGLAVSYIMVGLLVSVIGAPTIGFRLLAKQPTLPELAPCSKGGARDPLELSADKTKQATAKEDEDTVWLLTDAGDGSSSSRPRGDAAEVNGSGGREPAEADARPGDESADRGGEAGAAGPRRQSVGSGADAVEAGAGAAGMARETDPRPPGGAERDVQMAERRPGDGVPETGAARARAGLRLAPIDGGDGPEPEAAPSPRCPPSGGSSRLRQASGLSRLAVDPGPGSEPPELYGKESCGGGGAAGVDQARVVATPAAATRRAEAGSRATAVGVEGAAASPMGAAAEADLASGAGSSPRAWSEKPKWMLSRYTPEFLSFRKPSMSRHPSHSHLTSGPSTLPNLPPDPDDAPRSPRCGGPPPDPALGLLAPTHLVPTPPLLPSLLGRKRAAAFVSRSRDVVLLVLLEALSPPILSTLLAIFVGCIRPIQALFFGEGAPLSLLTDCLAMLSACAIPCVMIGLGATLANGPGAAKVPLRTLISVSVCRLVLLPLLGMIIVLGGYMAGAYVAPDAIFMLVMLLQNTAPTAILVHTMSAVHQNHDAQMSTLLFWQYLISIVTVPPYIALFLWAVGTTYHTE